MLKITKESTKQFVKRKGGGKAFNLYLLQQKNINVPQWICLSSDFFDDFLGPIKEELKSSLDDYINHATTAKVASTLIEASFLKTNFKEKTKVEIENIFKIFYPFSISVRSSGVDEDSGTHSFAGQLSSFLFVDNFDDVLLSIKKCFASGFSERCLSYRKENNLKFDRIQVAVILQRMVEAQISGVIFTHSPQSPFSSHPSHNLVINSVYGLGEGLVSGLLDADTYYIERESRKIISEIVEKKSQLNLSTKKIFEEISVPLHLQKSASLNDFQVNKLVDLAIEIESIYHRPQDIEWAIVDDEIMILQARPITTHFNFSHGDLYIWDNSNIIESYGGLTLPLTFGFAHFVYHQVYVQFCEILLVPTKQIKKMDYFLKNMLGLLNGRVYYNLLNWYKLTSILPGYKYNRQFMETMMGTSKSLENEIADRVRPPEFHEGITGKFLSLVSGLKFLYFHFTIQTKVDKFMSHFYQIYNQYQDKDYSLLNSHAIYKDYRELEEKLLWNWHAPIINDFLCMIHYGIFKTLTSRWLSSLGPSFQNDLMAGNGNLESALPTKELMRLAQKIKDTPELYKYLEKFSANDRLEALSQSEFKDFYQEVKLYIRKFGFRCMSEMKLEQKDMHQEPSLFFIFLNNLLKSNQIDLKAMEEREKSIRQRAENELKNLQGIKKLIYNWSLNQARKAVRNRENTRFCRTRIYGVVRSMMNGIGHDFMQSGIILEQSDIFYLTLDEVKGALEGTNTIVNFFPLIELRKIQYDEFRKNEIKARIITRGPVYWHNQFTEEESAVEISTAENGIKGIGCSPGIVEGIAKVILGPEDDLSLNGEILVTLRTDPGWIPLYPSAKGLLVERGGLLSHSAIVAREMGLPAIVGIKGLTSIIKSGMKIRMDGEKGLIEILDN